MTGLEIMAYQLDRHSRAERLAHLDAPELRRRGVEAARDLDQDQLWALVEAYLVLRGGSGCRISDHTLRAYRIGLVLLLDWARSAGMSFLSPKPNQGVAFIRYLEHKGLSPATVKNRLTAARCVFAALRWTGATDAAPFADTRSAPDPVPAHLKRSPYPEADLQVLLAAADMQTQVVILLGAHLGLRVSEMCALRRSEVFLQERQPRLVVERGKGGKRREVSVSRSAQAALERWMQATPQLTEYVLSWRSTRNVDRQLEALCERTGVRYDHRHVHGLRHSAGTRVYKATGDLLEVRDHLGHADISTSERYVQHARADKPPVNRDW